MENLLGCFGFCSYPSKTSINGRILEYLICDALLQDGISSTYYQARSRQSLNVDFDMIICRATSPVYLIDNLFWHDCFACGRLNDIWWNSDGQKGAIITDFWERESAAPTEGLKGRLNQVIIILAHGASGNTEVSETVKSKLEAEAVRLRPEIYKRTGDEKCFIIRIKLLLRRLLKRPKRSWQQGSLK